MPAWETEPSPSPSSGCHCSLAPLLACRLVFCVPRPPRLVKPQNADLTQWVLWGYGLTFTDSGARWWGGETRANGLADVVARPIATGDQNNGPFIPELLYVLYEGMFASFT